MKSKVAKGLVVLLFFLGVAWLSVGSFSDYLIGNRKMVGDSPECDDSSWCDVIRNSFIADAHSDTLMHRNPGAETRSGHVDLARMVEGGVNVQVFAIASVAPKIIDRENGATECGAREKGDLLRTYFFLKEPLRPTTWLTPMARIDLMIDRFDAALNDGQQSRPSLTPIVSRSDLVALIDRGPQDQSGIGALLAIEGAYWASEDKIELSSQLDKLENAGVRMIGLTHRSNNQLAGSNEECRRPHHGLTDLGYFAVAEIWKRNMILDLAHASSETIADVARLSAEGKAGPVIVSHAGVKSACDHDRNLSDEDLRNIVRSGGVASLGFWTTVNCFEGSVTAQEARQAIARSFVAAHQVLTAPEFTAEMAADYNPSAHLALGSDFDGATLVPADASAIPWYLEGIATFEVEGRRVFDRSAIENIAGLNLLRLIQSALEES